MTRRPEWHTCSGGPVNVGPVPPRGTFLDAMAQGLGVSLEDVQSKKRDAELVVARREMTRMLMGAGLTKTQVGKLLKKHRTSVHNLLKGSE